MFAACRGACPGRATRNFAICPECREQKYGFERARNYGQHEGALVRAILLLKYGRIAPPVYRAPAARDPHG
jgi:predicted amidophosphoribosyltransferase